MVRYRECLFIFVSGEVFILSREYLFKLIPKVMVLEQLVIYLYAKEKSAQSPDLNIFMFCCRFAEPVTFKLNDIVLAKDSWGTDTLPLLTRRF